MRATWRDTRQAEAVHAAMKAKGFVYLTSRQVDAVLDGLNAVGLLVTGEHPLVAALRRLAVADEMAGLGDVEDPEGLARVGYARAALEAAGFSLKAGGGG